MPYCQLFYHIVTATKNRQPLITSEVEPAIHQYLRSKALELEAIIYALNGTEDHIHLLVSIPPKIAVATFIGQVKAFASTRFNKTYPNLGLFPGKVNMVYLPWIGKGCQSILITSNGRKSITVKDLSFARLNSVKKMDIRSPREKSSIHFKAPFTGRSFLAGRLIARRLMES